MKKTRELESSGDYNEHPNDIILEFGSSPKQRGVRLDSKRRNSAIMPDYSKMVSSPVYMVPQNGVISELSNSSVDKSASGLLGVSLGASLGVSLGASVGNSSISGKSDERTQLSAHNANFAHNPQNSNFAPSHSFSKQLSKSQTDLYGTHDYGFKPSSVPTRGNYAQRIMTNVKSTEYKNEDKNEDLPQSSRFLPDNMSSVSSVSPPMRDFGMDFLFHLQAMRNSRSSLSPTGSNGSLNGQPSDTSVHNFKYLVLEGGGVKGVGLVGAISELYKTGEIRTITHIVGSSVGAIIGSLVACKIPYEQLEKYIFGLDFSKFRDSSWNPFKNIYNIQRKCGWYQGNELYEEHGNILRSIRGICADNPADVTFQEIYNLFGMTLVIPVTLVYKQGCISINCSRANFPNMPVRLASRYSASFPLWFEALPFLGTLTTDGGLLNNYPVDVFAEYPDFATRAIGLKLVSTHENRTMRNKIGETIPSRHISGETDFLGGIPSNAEEFTYSIVGAIYDNAQMMHIPAYASELTVNIDTGHISSMNFNISSVDKMMLFENGKEALRAFLRARTRALDSRSISARSQKLTDSTQSINSARSTHSVYSLGSVSEKKTQNPNNNNDFNEMEFLDLKLQK